MKNYEFASIDLFTLANKGITYMNSAELVIVHIHQRTILLLLLLHFKKIINIGQVILGS